MIYSDCEVVQLNKYDYYGIIEKKCARCGKTFIVAPQHIYKSNKKIYCSWTCYNHRKDEHCIMCGAIIPEGRQVCPICETEIKKSKKK